MAMTLKYVTVTGAGAKNGTDAANAWDWATMLTSAVAGDDVLIQEGTYTRSATSTFTNAGTKTSPIRLRGAKTDWTPLVPTRTNAGALSTTNMPVIAFGSTYQLNIPNWSILQSLKLTFTRNGSAVNVGTNAVIHGCVVENNSTGSSAGLFSCNAYDTILNCDLSMTGASGGANGYAVICYISNLVFGCRINLGAVATTGIYFGGEGCCACANVVFGGTGPKIASGGSNNSYFVLFNTLVGSGGTADGFLNDSGANAIVSLIGNLITDQTRYGINGAAAATGLLSAYNRLDRCTSAAYSGSTDWLDSTRFGDDVTSVAQSAEYEDAAAKDFRLKSTSPAIGKGPWLLGDIGALQTTGGGAAPSTPPAFSIGGRFGRRS